MKDLRNRNRYRLQRASSGPFSFAADGDRLTHAGGGVVFCASTYCTMLKRGWVRMEVL